MERRKYGCVLMIIFLMAFVLFTAVGKNRNKELPEEMILQAGAGIMDELEIIRSSHMFLHNVWIYVDQEIPFVDGEIFDMIRAAYEEVDYSAEFLNHKKKIAKIYRGCYYFLKAYILKS